MAGALLLNKFLDSLSSLFSYSHYSYFFSLKFWEALQSVCNLIALNTLLALIPHSLLLTPVPRLLVLTELLLLPNA